MGCRDGLRLRELRPLALTAAALLSACGGELQAPTPAEASRPGGNASDRPNAPNAPPSAPGVEPGPPGGPGAPRPFTCAPSAEPVPQSLRRLTRAQYAGVVRDLAEAALAGPLSASDDRRLEEALDSLPPDVLSEDEDYPSLVQAVGQAHVDAYHEVARGIAEVGAGAAAERCEGDCRGVLEDLAEVAFRRPVSAEELDFLATAMSTGDTPLDLARALELIAQTPDYLYRLEDGDPATGQVDAHELANRLAFHFWNAPPDEALLESAASGALLTDAGYEAEVDRVFDDPRTRQALHGFFEAWLKLEEIPPMDANVDRADFQAYAGDDLPGPNLQRELIEDVLAFVDHVVWAEGGSFADLFTRSVAVPPSPAVASLYGVDTVGAPVELDPSRRAGLLSRPGLLAYNQAATRPIIRGTLVRVRLSCADLALPDNMDDIQIPEANPGETTRAKVEDLTETPGTTCVGCHMLINPFGFALEQYDALGRYRTEERAFGDDGAMQGSHPLDLITETPVDGRPIRFEGPVEMSAALAHSQDVERCFARHYFRHSFGRVDDPSRDGCTLEQIRSRIHEGAPLSEVFRAIAFTPEFRRLEEVYE